MTTNQYPKRRETDVAAAKRAEDIAARNDANKQTSLKLSFTELFQLANPEGLAKFNLTRIKHKRR